MRFAFNVIRITGYSALPNDGGDENSPRNTATLQGADKLAAKAPVKETKTMTAGGSDLLRPYDIPAKDTTIKVHAKAHKGRFNEQADWPAAPEAFSALYGLLWFCLIFVSTVQAHDTLSALCLFWHAQ